jgi:cyclophilin family peptidyl-prolyl cis-trans isomerase
MLAATLAGCEENRNKAGPGAAAGSDEWSPPKQPIRAASQVAKPPVYQPLVYNPEETYEVVVKTTLGDFRLGLYNKETPATVASFFRLVMSGFYENLTFNRVIAGALIQGGDPQGDGTGNPGYGVPDEFTDRQFVAGTVGLSHNANPDSGGCQWFVCLKRQGELDHKYAAFGYVKDGLEVVEKISRVPVAGSDAVVPSLAQQPVDPPVIKSMEIIKVSKDQPKGETGQK